MKAARIGLPLLASMIIGVAACSSPEFSTGPNSRGDLRVHLAASQIRQGETVLLQAALAEPEERFLDGSLVTWSSSAPTVASISSTGLVQGVGLGAAEITATYGSSMAKVSIAVVQGAACVTSPEAVPEGCPPPIQ